MIMKMSTCFGKNALGMIGINHLAVLAGKSYHEDVRDKIFFCTVAGCAVTNFRHII